jgi:succinyl-CoA synthetase alpha subunit
VTPWKGGSVHEGIPVFDSVGDAVKEAGANTSIIFVPRQYSADAVMEAADGGIKLVVCITEGIPVFDMMKIKPILQEMGVRLIGPNCPGIISPGKSKVGIMPGYIHKTGSIGVISRSGTLTYEVVAQLTSLNLGQSTCIGIGGDPIPGMNFVDCLELFRDDPETDAVVMIGEIGGNAEELAAEYVTQHVKKPVAAFIAGKTAPPGRRMGHAGAIIAGGKGTAAEKIAKLRDCGIAVADNPAVIGETLARVIQNT